MAGIQDKIDALYAQYDEPVEQNSTGSFVCPVCKKEYKTEKGAYKHRDERNCLTISAVCHGDPIEYDAVSVYGFVVNAIGTDKHVSVRSLRKNTSYNAILKLVYLLKRKKMFNNAEMFINWCATYYDITKAHTLIHRASQELTFLDFSLDIQNYPEYIDSAYLDKHLDDFIESPKMILSRMKTGFVSLEDVIHGEKYQPLREAINKQQLIAQLITEYYNQVNEKTHR